MMDDDGLTASDNIIPKVLTMKYEYMQKLCFN